MNPTCELCDGTEYEERNGHFYCTDCNRQSQVMGTVKELENREDHRTTVIKINSGRTRRTSTASSRSGISGVSLSGIPAKPWSIAEGYTQILNVWCTKLEKLGVDRIREPVLDVWTVYLNTIKAAFTSPNEYFDEAGSDQRSVSVMHYRDKWNFLNGPTQVTERSRLLGYGTKQKREDAKRKQRDADKGKPETEKERRKLQRDYLKAVSGTLTVSESEYEDEEMGCSKSEAGSVVSEKTDIDYESDISEMITTAPKTKIKTPAGFTLRNVRAVFVLAATCLPGTSVTSSDLAQLFSSDFLPWATCIQFLPKSYKPTLHDKLVFSGQKMGLQLITEAVLRKEAAELATLIQITNPLKLTLCTPVTFECVLRRYIEDLCLPETIFQDICRTFSSCCLMTLSAEASSPGKLRTSDIPVVTVRILGLILITLKYHFGLNDIQEYELSKIVTKYNASFQDHQNMDQDDFTQEQESGKNFDFLSWLRLSKLRLDYLISNNFTLREQFRRFRHIGVPGSSLQSMDEPRQIYQNKTESRNPREDLYHKLGEHLENDLGGSEFQSRVSQVESFKFLEESTNICLEEEDDESVKANLVRLLDMKAQSIQVYRTIYKNCMNNEDDQESNLVQIGPVIPQKYHSSILQCPTVPSSGIQQVNMSENQDKVSKKYWFSPFTARNGNSKKFFFNRSACDTDFCNYIQFLPENYLWVLNYFSCYAMVPLHLLENEVEYLEEYIYKLDKSFFGKDHSEIQKKPEEDTQHSQSSTCCRQEFESCDCHNCQDIDKLYPKELKRIF